jgi:ATP-dependent Lon protease
MMVGPLGDLLNYIGEVYTQLQKKMADKTSFYRSKSKKRYNLFGCIKWMKNHLNKDRFEAAKRQYANKEIKEDSLPKLAQQLICHDIVDKAIAEFAPDREKNSARLRKFGAMMQALKDTKQSAAKPIELSLQGDNQVHIIDRSPKASNSFFK